MGAEAFEVNFGENKSIGVNVNFSKGDAIQVPVSINSLDAEKVGDRIAGELDETLLQSVAKETTLLEVKNAVENIKLPEIDTSELAKQGENPEATNSKILEEVGKIPNIARLYTAYAVKNDDGENTYSIVLPVSADIINETTIKLQ